MHRYVDLHYQYLTSSYACMLSCPISLRPFVILEGTGLGPEEPRDKTRGACVTGTHVGEVIFLLYCIYRQQTNKWSLLFHSLTLVHLLSTWKLCWVFDTASVLNVVSARPKWKIFILGYLKIAARLSMHVHKHVFLRSVKALSKSAKRFSFTQNYALNVIVWVHVPFFVIIEKKYEFVRERCKEVYNHKLCIHQFVSILWASLWARWLRQRGIHGALFCSPYIWLVFITFPLTIHLDS